MKLNLQFKSCIKFVDFHLFILSKCCIKFLFKCSIKYFQVNHDFTYLTSNVLI